MCSTLFDPVDCCQSSSSVHGSLQARILEWVAMPSFRGSYQPRDQTCISYVFSIGKWVPYHQHCLSESQSIVSDSLQSHGLYSPWNSSGQNTGVGSLSLFQGIFPTQGLNPGLLHCRQIHYHLSHKGSPVPPECF